MAQVRGCKGVVKVASAATGPFTAFAELTDWNFTESAERIDASVMGSCAKQFKPGAVETSGTFTAWWDPTDAGQALLSIGTTSYLEVYPDGTGSGSSFYTTPTGGAEIISISRQGGGVNGLVGNEYAFAINGALTATSVP